MLKLPIIARPSSFKFRDRNIPETKESLRLSFLITAVTCRVTFASMSDLRLLQQYNSYNETSALVVVCIFCLAYLFFINKPSCLIRSS